MPPRRPKRRPTKQDPHPRRPIENYKPKLQEKPRSYLNLKKNDNLNIYFYKFFLSFPMLFPIHLIIDNILHLFALDQSKK